MNTKGVLFQCGVNTSGVNRSSHLWRSIHHLCVVISFVGMLLVAIPACAGQVQIGEGTRVDVQLTVNNAVFCSERLRECSDDGITVLVASGAQMEGDDPDTAVYAVYQRPEPSTETASRAP